MATYYDELWAELDDIKKFGPASRHTRRLIRKALQGVQFDSLLDVGCGDGMLLRNLAADSGPAKTWYGLDVSEEAVKMAKSNTATHVFVWDISAAPPPVRTDVTVCSEVLEHIIDDVAALRNIAQQTSVLIITVPAGIITPDQTIEGHLRSYNRETILSKCDEAGLEVVKLRAWGFPFYDLYKRITANRPRSYKTGRYSPLKRLMCHALYYLFMLNVVNKGERLVITARRINSQRPAPCEPDP